MTKLIKKFFWVCSGATVPLLEKCETEHNKYVGIGATVLMTGILAGISAGYALYTVFWSIEWAAVFGTLWGLMIFNLDRLIILSIKKKEADPAWTWRRRVREKTLEVFAMLPRIGLAVLLAIVITKPLELKLFEKEVEIEMDSMKIEGENNLQASLGSSSQPQAGRTQSEQAQNDQPPANQAQADSAQPGQTQQLARIAAQINSLKQEVTTLRQQIDDKKDQWSTAEQEANCECYGTCGSHRPGVGVNCKRERDEAEVLKTIYLKASDEKSEINRQISADLKQIDELEEVRAGLASSARQKRNDAKGLATRLSAFNRLTRRDPVYGGANLAIMLIFILLETAPILAKLFSSYGTYDKLTETTDLRMNVAQMKEQLTLVDDIIQTQQSSDKYRKAVQEKMDEMLEDFGSEAVNASEHSAQLQSEWSHARREFEREVISRIRKQTRSAGSNGTS